MADIFCINEEVLRFSFVNRTEEHKDRINLKQEADWHHYGLFDSVSAILCEECRFEKSDVPFDELVDKHYPSLWKDKQYGGNAHLRFRGERYPAGFFFEFWYRDSRTGRKDNLGNYDFDKWDHSTNLERLVFLRAARKIMEFFKLQGYAGEYERRIPFGREAVMKDIESLHQFQGENYTYEKYKDRLGGNARDRDKKLIENKQVKYFRDWSGRLMRGEVLHAINNMWWVIINDSCARKVSSFDLFDPTPEDFKNRKFARDRANPDEKVRRKIGTKLYNELRKKGISMSIKE